MSLKFYTEERERNPDLNLIKATNEEAEAAIRKLTRHYFGNFDGQMQIRAEIDPAAPVPVVAWGGQKWVANPARPIVIEWKRGGSTWSHAYGATRIEFCPGPTWLLIVHEFAHVYEVRKYGSTNHRKRMARAVDRICDYVRKMGWAQASLDAKFSAWCATQIEKPDDLYEVKIMQTSEGLEFMTPPERVRSAACPVQVDPDALADVEHDLNVAAKRAALDKKISAREAQVKRLERRIKSLTTRAKKATRSLRALKRSRDRLI